MFDSWELRKWIEEHERAWNLLSIEEQNKLIEKNLADRARWEEEISTKSLDEIIGASIAESLGKPGWTYRDLPRMVPELFYKLIDILGEDNVQFITLANYGDTLRGQLLISPAGMSALAEFNAR